eukprot:548500-Amphidinium_carterae.1
MSSERDSRILFLNGKCYIANFTFCVKEGGTIEKHCARNSILKHIFAKPLGKKDLSNDGSCTIGLLMQALECFPREAASVASTEGSASRDTA